MVHQIETETADNGEHAGAGRIPAGFSTMTCAVYKWEQLHTTILKSYPPGSASDTASDTHTREYYEQWRSLPEGSSEREQAMKKRFTNWRCRIQASWRGTVLSSWKWLFISRRK